MGIDTSSPPNPNSTPNPKERLVKIGGFVLGAGLFFFGVYGIYSRFNLNQEDQKKQEPKARLMSQILQEDEKKIIGLKEATFQNINSILRLARENNPNVKKFLESQLEIESGAIGSSPLYGDLLKAAGFYLDENFEKKIQSSFLNSKKQEIQSAALLALSNVSSESRKVFLQNIYNNKNTIHYSEHVGLVLIESLLKLQPDKIQQTKYFNDLQEYLKNPTRKNLFYALQVLLNYSWLEVDQAKEKIDKQIKEILTSKKYPDEIRVVVLTYLIQIEDQDLKANYKKFVDTIATQSSFLLRRALESIPKVCPGKRWDILYWYVSEKKFIPLREVIIKVAVQLNENESGVFLNKALSSRAFGYEDKVLLKNAITQLNQQQESNKLPRCR